MEFKDVGDYLAKGTNDKAKKTFIKNYFEANRIPITKVIRAKLNDGWYVYHEAGTERKAYKPPKIIERTETSVTRQTQPYQIKSVLVLKDSAFSLDIAVIEARNRMGLSKESRVKLEDFYIERLGG